APENTVVYEVHVRDFSATDETVEPALRGKFKAFTGPADGSVDSVAHLKAMADAGVTHLHLLPAFDIGTVNDGPAAILDIAADFGQRCDLSEASADDYGEQCQRGKPSRQVLESFAPRTGDAPALYNAVRRLDSFNWGYDPVPFTVPEGS